MEHGKLIKTGLNYDLVTEDGDGEEIWIGTSSDYKLKKLVSLKNPLTDELIKISKLSLKNCQAIVNGYDLDDLIKKEITEGRLHPNDGAKKEGILRGVQIALEILGDKKFDEEDILIAIEAGYHAGVNHNVDEEEQGDKIIRLKDLVIPSLQQTQWDVEIEMEYQGFKKDYKPIEAYLPKLDADGCLILKRK